MSNQPSISPIAALNKLSNKKYEFYDDSFLFQLDLSGEAEAVMATEISTGIVWFVSGEANEKVDENSTWIKV